MRSYVVSTPLKTAEGVVPAGEVVELDDLAAAELLAVGAIEPPPSGRGRKPAPQSDS